MTEQLEDALASAFPPVKIDRAMIDEPSAVWEAYLESDELGAFEGKSWRDFEPELLWRHSSLPVCAGDTMWRAVLPGYLVYLLRERHRFNDLPYQVASQLTRSAEPEYQPKFDRRTALLSPAQRAVIRDVIAYLATVPPAEEVMSRALATWNT